MGYENDDLKMPNKIIEMGLLPDTTFKILYQAPFSGPLYVEFGDEKSRCVRASIVRSRRKEQADQVQLSLTTIDDPAFVSFRRLLHTGDYLVILKHKEKLVYDCIGIKANG